MGRKEKEPKICRWGEKEKEPRHQIWISQNYFGSAVGPIPEGEGASAPLPKSTPDIWSVCIHNLVAPWLEHEIDVLVKLVEGKNRI